MLCLFLSFCQLSPPPILPSLPFPPLPSPFSLVFVLITVPSLPSFDPCPSSLHLITPTLSLPPCLQDPGGQQVGFLLGSLGAKIALTSETTAKALPKEEGKDHIVHFKVCLSVYMYIYMYMYVCVSVCACLSHYVVYCTVVEFSCCELSPPPPSPPCPGLATADLVCHGAPAQGGQGLGPSPEASAGLSRIHRGQSPHHVVNPRKYYASKKRHYVV